jgi:hypothetical protein
VWLSIVKRSYPSARIAATISLGRDFRFSTLGFAGTQIDARALGFEHGKGAPLTIEQGIIRLTAVIERVFETDTTPVSQLPVCIA